MKKTSKILSVVLAIIMVMSIIPITASAATYSGSCGDNLTWTYNSSNGYLTISGTGEMDDYETDNRPWESYEDKIKAVVVEDGVTTIGARAFYDCEKLVTVTLADSVITIGRAAFAYCNYLSNVTLSDSLTTIDYAAFNNCVKLENISIPNSVTIIGAYAFNDCEKLKSINIPNGVTLIGDYTFFCCKELTEITIPNSVTEIGLKAFYGCDGLTEIIIPDSVTTIGEQAFEYCDGLTSITLGSGVETIGKYAFGGCVNITSLTIPANVTTIEYGAFRYCESMLNITVDSNNPNFSNDEYGVLFNKDKTVLMQYTLGSTAIRYNIPGTVTEIGNYAFAHSNGLIDVVIPDTVTTIGLCGFSSCKNINSITLGTNITTLGDYAFYYSDRFVTFNYNGTSNQWNDLLENNSDKSGILPVSYAVHCSDKDIYPSCGDNVSWIFDYDTGVLTIFGTGDMDNYTYSTITGFCNYPWRPFYYQIKEVLICDGVTSIGNAAFCECDNLTKITIPDTVTKIGKDAFYLSDNISNIVVPDSVTTIGERAFGSCDNLSNVTIGDGVTTIGEKAFYYCTNLTSMVIPINVTSIGDDAFKGCSGITDVYYEGTEEQWKDNFVIYNGYIVPPTEPFKNATIHYNYHIHRYSSTVISPTCTEQGYTTYTCECGDTYTDYVDALGHNYQEEITTPATHTTTGVMTYTCTCGDSYTEVIAKIEKHNYESVITAPTCTEQGYTTYTCECGDSYVDDYVNALGHTEETIPSVAPTCTETGLTEGAKCSVCGETLIEQETVSATDHADNDNDGYCDGCTELLDPSVECDHNCHNSGISGFFWKIINLFNKLFGLNNTCSCGAAHY